MITEQLELQTYTFDELEIGQEASIRFTVKADDVEAFSSLSGDYSPLHTDEEFARRTRYRGRVVQGVLVTLPLSALVGMCLPGQNATLMSQQIHYKNPVRVGDELTLTASVKSKSPATRTITLEFEIAKESITVASGSAQVLVSDPPKLTPTMEELAPVIESLGLDFDGAVALVTGASRGIGAVVAKLLAGCDAKVIVGYYKGPSNAHQVGSDITSAGKRASCLQIDVSKPIGVDKYCGITAGIIDILVNNAVGNAIPIPFVNLSCKQMYNSLGVTFWGAFNCTKAVLPGMFDNGKGVIVNITTQALDNPPSGSVAYVSAKAALDGLTKALTVEMEPRGVKVRAYAPPATDTDLLAYVPAYHKAQMKLAHPVDVASEIVELIGELWTTT